MSKKWTDSEGRPWIDGILDRIPSGAPVFSAEERAALVGTPAQTVDDVLTKLASSIEILHEIVQRQGARIRKLENVVRD